MKILMPVISKYILYALAILFLTIPVISFAEETLTDENKDITIEEIETKLLDEELIEEPTVEEADSDDAEEKAEEEIEAPVFKSSMMSSMAVSTAVSTPTPPSPEEAIFSAGSHAAVPNVSMKIGSATLGYPIQVPPGRNGLAPNVSLNYNSAQGAGLAGVGWSISTSVIQRSTKHGVCYSCTDFTYNGEDLVPITVDENGYGTYRPEQEQAFSIIEYIQGSTSNSGYWEVTSKSGIKQSYGTLASATQTDASGQIFSWYLQEIEDIHNNTITYNYEKEQGQVYPDSISWIDGFYTVSFYYETRSDIITNYTTTDPIRTDKRLKTIEVTTNSEPGNIRAYDLTYTTSANTSRSLLNQITMYGSDYSLDPTTFAVDAGTSFPSTEITYTHDLKILDYSHFSIQNDLSMAQGLTNYNEYPMVQGDFNGDGKKDIGRAGNSDIQFYNSNGHLFETFSNLSDLTKGQGFTNSYEHPMITGDWNGDGKTDVGRLGESSAKFYISTPTGFELYTTFSGLTKADSFANIDEYPVFTGDFNGDGKTDIGRTKDTDVIIYHSTGTGFEPATGISGDLAKNNGFPNNNENPLFTGDFNGDGNTDIGRVTSDGVQIYLSNGNGFTLQASTFAAFGKTTCPDFKTYPVITGDFNGDGLTDIGRAGETNLITYLSTGIGFVTGPVISNDFTKNNGYPTFNENPIFTGDFNDDGRTDVGRVSASGVVLYVATGTTFNKYNTDVNQIADLSPAQGFTNQSEHPLITGDFTGTGITGIARINDSGVVFYGPTSDAQIDPKGPTDLASSIVSSTGNTTQITYTPSSEYENILLPFVLQTVSQIITDDGLGNTSTTSYEYSGGLFDYAHRELRCFEFATKTLPNGTKEITQFHQSNFLDGKAIRSEKRDNDAGQTLLAETDYIWEAITFEPENTSAFIKLTQQTSTSYENNSSVFSTQTYTYDEDHGSLLTQTLTGTGLATAVNTQYEYAYYGPGGGYPLRIENDTLYSGSDPDAYTRKSVYGYDNDGILITITALDRDNSTNPTVEFGYDGFGNVTTITDARGNTSTYTYDTDLNTYVVQIQAPLTGTNQVQHVVQYPEAGIDYRYGKPTSAINANNFTTNYSYDIFGRITQVNHPDNGLEIYTYDDTFDRETFKPRSIIKQVKDGEESYIQTITYMDGFGRTRQVVAKSMYKHVISLFSFDDMGRQESAMGPFIPTEDTTAFLAGDLAGMPDNLSGATGAMWTKNYYDSRSRPVRVESNGDINAYMAYDNLKTTATDPDGHQKSQITDILGRVIKILEHNPNGTDQQINYTYNIAGDLLLVSRPHPVTLNPIENIVTYNTLGQKMSMTDPDMGHWEYTYDLNGNLKTQTDSRGITLTFDYDELNRQIKKTYPDQSVALYEYDAATNGIGFLFRTINANATIEISSYDALGRPLSENKIIAPSTDVISYDYTYDLVGRVSSKTILKNYTALQTFSYTFYPGTSLLHQVMDGNNQAYAEITQYSPQGKIEAISYQNQSVLTNYAYSAKTGRLDAINSYRTSDFIPLSYKIYEYSKAGDITLISDVVKEVDFIYTYDHAHRLISEETQGEGGDAATTVEVIEFTYGEEESNPADYPVHAPSKIHTQTTASQEITISTTNYTYSAAGNRIGKIEGSIASSYISNDDNMIESINVNGVTTNFTYDANNQRAKKTQGANTTFYFSQDFEIINNTPTFYLFAGTLRIGMVSGNSTMFFVKDHLGSTNAIVTNDGQIVDTGEYMPYGQDRSSNDLLQTSSYKFTDQEQDDGTGLYNYNARLYDPVIGQFIMADTIVPDMFNSQSLNRYAYCLNNPVRYVDPTGHYDDGGTGVGMGEGSGGPPDGEGVGDSVTSSLSSLSSFFSGFFSGINEMNDVVGYALDHDIDFMTFDGLAAAEKGLSALNDSIKGQLGRYNAEIALQQYDALCNIDIDLNSYYEQQDFFDSIPGVLVASNASLAGFFTKKDWGKIATGSLMTLAANLIEITGITLSVTALIHIPHIVATEGWSVPIGIAHLGAGFGITLVGMHTRKLGKDIIKDGWEGN